MKILTEEETKNLTFGRESYQPTVFTEAFKKLQIGENLLITKEEWGEEKTTPSRLSPVWLRQGKRMTRKTLADKSGWVFTRVK